MNKNKIVSGVAVLLSVTGVQSYAAGTQLQFTGTVSSVCAFTAVNNGTLAVSPVTPYIIGSTPGSTGTPGSVTIAYNSTPTITVNPISSFQSSPNISGISNPQFATTAAGQNSGSFSYANGVYTQTYSSGSSDVITINLEANTGNTQVAWPTGSYSATTTVTCQ